MTVIITILIIMLVLDVYRLILTIRANRTNHRINGHVIEQRDRWNQMCQDLTDFFIRKGK